MRFLLCILALPLLCLACSSPVTVAPPRTLRVVMGQGLTTMDPHLPFDDVSSVIHGNIFETLVRFDNRFRLTGRLAERWINPNDRTWRFFLSPSARFSDGSRLLASDVRFSLERARTLPGSQLSGLLQHVSQVDVVDDATVDVHTDTPLAIMNSLTFVPIMSERHVRAAGEKVGESPVGTGPYKLVSWEHGKSLLLEANPHYSPAPPISRVEVVFDDGAGGLDAVIRHRPDLVLYLRLTLVEQLNAHPIPGLKVVPAGGLSVLYVAFNIRSARRGEPGTSPLADLRVRRALALATDPQRLIEKTRQGYGRPTTQLVVPSVFGFDPSIPTITPDPDAARSLVLAAGHVGAEIALDVDATSSQRVEKLLAEQWARSGLRVKLVPHSPDDLTRALENGGFSTTLLGYVCTSADSSELLSFALHTRDLARGYGQLNYSGYSNPEVDAITENNLQTLDPRKRLAMLQRALTLVSQDLPYLPLLSGDDIYVISDRLRWTPSNSGEVRLDEIGFAPEAR